MVIKNKLSLASHHGTFRDGLSKGTLDKILAPRNRRSNEFVSNLLINSAEAVGREQYAMLDSATVEQSYQLALKEYANVKKIQAHDIGIRLEKMIAGQQKMIKKIAPQPKFWSSAENKRAWRENLKKNNLRLRTLQGRLDVVRSIEESMGVDRPKIEELATRKLRIFRPDIARSWDAVRQNMRFEELEKKISVQDDTRQTTHKHTKGGGMSVSLQINKDEGYSL
jgi:hypothetical protein